MSKWCEECGGAVEVGICLTCGDDSNYATEREGKR